MAEEDKKILGVWTKDEFIDSLIYAAVVAVVSFSLTLFYRYLSKWLELKKWG